MVDNGGFVGLEWSRERSDDRLRKKGEGAAGECETGRVNGVPSCFLIRYTLAVS